MKSNIFIKVIDEKVFEIDQNSQLVINRLRLQDGVCREKDSDGDRLQFTCSKKGKFMVSNVRDTNGSRHIDNNRMYYVRGKVIANGDKTKIAIYTVHDCALTYYKWISLITDMIWFFVNVILLFFTDIAIDKRILAVSLVATVALLPVIFSLTNEHNYRKEDIEIMQNEAIKRVEALKRWDE